MLIRCIDWKAYCVRSMREAWKTKWLLESFLPLRFSLTMDVFYMLRTIACIHELQIQFPQTSQADICTTCFSIALFISRVSISIFFLKTTTCILFIWCWGWMFHNAHLEDHGQLTEVSSLLPPCKSWGLNSDCKDWQQALNQWSISMVLHPSTDASPLMTESHLINPP